MNMMAVNLTALSLAAFSSIPADTQQRATAYQSVAGATTHRAWSSHNVTFGSRTMPNWSAWKSERSPRRPSTPGVAGAA